MVLARGFEYGESRVVATQAGAEPQEAATALVQWTR